MVLDYDIWNEVMNRFPKLENERTCRIEREMREKARMSYYNTLYERKRKAELLEAKHTDNT